MFIKMSLKRFKDWWNKTNQEYSKTYEYRNREYFVGYLLVGMFFGGAFGVALGPESTDGIFALMIIAVPILGLIFFMFFQPYFTLKFIYIAEKVKHTVDGQELIMYKWDKKLFYSLSDIEIFEELDPKGIKFIDLRNNKHIENEIDENKLWDKVGESQKTEESFKVFEKPKITPELKKLMPDLIESEEE